MAVGKEPLFRIEGDLKPLLQRLKKGMVLRSRIVYALGNNQYLLRLFGYNLLMESELEFKRFDEIEIEVKKLYPKLHLSVTYAKDKDKLDIFV